MSGASTSIMLQDVSGPMHLAGDGAHSSMPTLQPVFIPRGAPLNSLIHIPNSPLGATQTASADWAYLLRSAAAMSQPSQGALGAAMDGLATGSSFNNIQELVTAGMRASPQLHSSPNLLYSPASSTAPASSYFNSMAEMGTDGLGNSAGDHANSLVMQLSNSNNLAAAAAAAASATYGDNSGVQTLYPSSRDALTAAANAARQAVQTQTLLQQQATAVNSLSNGLGSLGLSSLAANGLSSSNPMEESLSGSLFAAAAAGAAVTTAAAASKPVSASLYIKNLPPDADKLFLYEKFSPFGSILSVKVLVDPQTGQCRGVGFVNCAEHGSAIRSIQALHGTKVGDKSMHVSLQTPRIRASALHGM